jgi:hypothetical protein
MRRAIRHVLSVSVGLAVTVAVAQVATTGHLLTVSLLPLYTAVSAMLVAHRDAMRQISSDGAIARKRGAIGGGVGAFTLGFLLQASIPAGVAGFGLMLLGMALVVGDVSDAE